MFIDTKRNKALSKYRDSGQQQADQMHHVLPTNPVVIAKILL